MSKQFNLITVNSNGSISYVAKGTYRAMRKRATECFHIVTSICDYNRAQRKYGINR